MVCELSPKFEDANRRTFVRKAKAPLDLKQK